MDRQFLRDLAVQAKIKSLQRDQRASFKDLDDLGVAIYDKFVLRHRPRNSFGGKELKLLAKRLGKDVKSPSSFPAKIRGFNDNREKVIYVSNQITPEQQRFTLGHEIAHTILEHPSCGSLTEILMGDPSLDKLIDFHWKELEANYLAGAILMPRYLYKQKMKEYQYNIARLATEFEVTYETAAHRMVVLAPFDMHFVRVNSDLQVVKSYTNNDIEMPYTGFDICRRSSAAKVIKDGQDFLHQVSYFKELNESYYCQSRLQRASVGQSGPYSVSIGCKAEDANHFGVLDGVQKFEVWRCCGRTMCPGYLREICDEDGRFSKQDLQLHGLIDSPSSPCPIIERKKKLGIKEKWSAAWKRFLGKD